jgi:hypothetical protein
MIAVIDVFFHFAKGTIFPEQETSHFGLDPRKITVVPEE